MANSFDKLFGDEKLTIDCPVCGRRFKVKMRQLTRDGSIIHCPSCETDIELQHDATTKRTLRDVERATKKFEKSLKDLEKAFKKLGK